MKNGQIVRRKLKNGVPVGPYMMINGFVGRSMVSLVTLKSSEPDPILSRDNIYELKSIKMVLSDLVVDRILAGRQGAIIHDISPKWKKLMDEEPEIIQIRSIKYSNKVAIFTVEYITIVYYNRKPQIRLQFGQMLL